MPEGIVVGQILALEKVACAFAKEIRKRDPQAANAIAAQLEQDEMSTGALPKPGLHDKALKELTRAHNSVLSSVRHWLEVD